MVKTNYFNRFRRRKGKAKPKAKPKRRVRGGGMTFAQRVNKLIARNIENKYTVTASSISAVGRLTTTGGPLPTPIVTQYGWYTYSPQSLDSIFDISQGVQETERVGNKIKIKRWIIKGSIQPKQEFLEGTGGTAASNSLQGYVDVYFGRYNQNSTPVGSDLTSFYQTGNLDTTPTGSQGDKLARVNKNVYKIYWHRRFKVGMGANQVYALTSGSPVPPAYTQLNSTAMPSGAGFKPAVTFGFDICKYICKNRVLNYTEGDIAPQDNDIKNLTLWATFIPIVSDLTYVGNPSGPTPIINDTFYEILTSCYAEYEDA